MSSAIGLIEVSSIALGYEIEDAMLKAARVELLLARTICSGKYLVVVGGEVGAVNTSVEAGLRAAREGIIDHVIVPRVDRSVFPALSGAVELKPEEVESLGIVETFSAACTVEAADAAVKAGGVILFRVHLAMAIGGKGFLLVTGPVGACEAAVAAASAVASERGLLVHQVVIAGPRRELFREFI